MIGLGNAKANIRIYIENTPPLPFYKALAEVQAMHLGEIKDIGENTGNHWRKIFNVMAKLIFELTPQHYQRWQDLRDEYLLQKTSNELLLFSTTLLDDSVLAKQSKKIHIVMGKNYACKLGLTNHVTWVNEFFAINKKHRLIICPYFDYRQLSNIKITQLATLIRSLNPPLSSVNFNVN